MANKTAIRRPSHCTPKGSLLFTHVTAPDYGTEKYPNPEGSYSAQLILSAEDSDALKASLANEIEEARHEAAEKFNSLKPQTRAKFGNKVTWNDVCEPEYDRNDEPTGNYRWKFKTAAFFTDRQTGRKRERSVPVFDSMNQRVMLDDEPGNGSVAKISFTSYPYFVDGQGMGGLKLYLNALQILTLYKGGEKSAEDYGFAEEADGGFAVETPVDTSVRTTADAPSAADGGFDDVPF